MNNIEVPSQDIKKLKVELADKYVKDLQKELNFLEKAAVLLVEKKIKELLLQDSAFGEKITDIKLTKFEQFLVSLSPKSADKVFEFLKEKQKLILRASTKEELENLKKDIIAPVNEKTDNGGHENNDTDKMNASAQQPKDRVHPVSGQNPYADAAILAAGAGLDGMQMGAREGIKWTQFEGKIGQRGEKLAQALTEGNLRKGFGDVIRTLETRLLDTQLLPAQKKNIQKTIDLFRQAENSADAVTDLKSMKKLVKNGKLQGDLFGKMKAADMPHLAKSMEAIMHDGTLLEQLSKANDKAAVEALLKQKGITGLSDEALRILTQTKDIETMKSVTTVFSKSEKIFTLAKVTRAIPFLDLAFMGVEIMHWNQSQEEADALLNKERGDVMRQRANSHLVTNLAGIGVPATLAAGAAIYSLCTGLACSGPPGWVILGGIAGAEALNYGMDKLIFDVKDYYAQNKDDFTKQYRTEIKQAIAAAAAGASWDNLSFNEHTAEFFVQVGKERKMKTLNDAVWAMIYLEEVHAFPAIIAMDAMATQQTPAATEQKQALESLITTRMEYITPYLPGGNNAAELARQTKAGNGMGFIERIVADSSVYEKMKTNGSYAKDVESYKKETGEALKSRNAVMFDSLNTLYTADPMQAVEFAQNVSIFRNTTVSISEYQEQYAKLLPTIEFIDAFFTWKQLGLPYEQKHVLHSLADMNYVAIEKSIESLAAGGKIDFVGVQLTPELLKRRLIDKGDADRYNEIEQYSGKLGQDVLYRIAKEVHGYNGPNELKMLQDFFSIAKDKSVGIYYNAEKNMRFINNDNAVDQAINLHDLEKHTAKDLMNSWFKEVPTWQILIASGIGGPLFTPITTSMLPKSSKKDMLDTATETADNHLNKEFFEKVFLIVSEEQELHSEKNREKVMHDIKLYVGSNSKEGYIKLPYYLINQAARAGMPNLQYWYFQLDAKNMIHACTTDQYVSTLPAMSGRVKEYITVPADGTPVPTDMSQILIQSVDATKHEGQAIESIDTMVTAIQRTCGEITWHGRGKVSYNPATKEIQSWGGKIRCEIVNGQRKIDGLSISYKDMTEALWTANLINWFREYKKNHTDAEFGWGYMGVAGGVYNRSTMPDTQIIDPETAEKTYRHSFDTKDHRDAFLSYIQNTV